MTRSAGAQPGWNRFAGLPRAVAAAVLALLAALILLGVLHDTPSAPTRAADAPAVLSAEGMIGDHALYLRTVRRMEAGEPYYSAIVSEQRAASYPLRPFFVVRPPTLALAISTIGLTASTVIAGILGIAAIIAWRRRLMQDDSLPPYSRYAALLIAVNLGQVMAGQWVLMHEVMAGALIALALALYRPERPWWTMAIVAIALAIRETVLPVAALLGLFALIDRNWKAVAGWLAIGIAFAIGMALHAAAVAALTTPADLSSQGWTAMGGWSTYIGFIRRTSAISALPFWFTAVLTPLALLGWAAWNSRLGGIGFLIQAGYAALFMTVARPDNFYWGMLVVPTLFIGLVFAPAAVAALWRSVAPAHAHAGLAAR